MPSDFDESSDSHPRLPRRVDISRQMSDSFMWKSGCFRVDPRMFLFSAQLIISLMILGFCLVKLFYSDTCEAQALYGNIVITLIGLWMPSPLHAERKRK